MKRIILLILLSIMIANTMGGALSETITIEHLDDFIGSFYKNTLEIYTSLSDFDEFGGVKTTWSEASGEIFEDKSAWLIYDVTLENEKSQLPISVWIDVAPTGIEESISLSLRFKWGDLFKQGELDEYMFANILAYMMYGFGIATPRNIISIYDEIQYLLDNTLISTESSWSFYDNESFLFPVSIEYEIWPNATQTDYWVQYDFLISIEFEDD